MATVCTGGEPRARATTGHRSETTIHEAGVQVSVMLIVLGVMSCCACTSDAPPTALAATAPDVDPGPPPAIPTTEGATIRLAAGAVTPKQVRVYQGTRVTFVNQDSSNHEIQSDPLHLHTDCPALNSIGLIVPGQARVSDPFLVARPCGFHDHVNEGDARFYGTVFVDPR
jgi:hypothetical protein